MDLDAYKNNREIEEGEINPKPKPGKMSILDVIRNLNKDKTTEKRKPLGVVDQNVKRENSDVSPKLKVEHEEQFEDDEDATLSNQLDNPNMPEEIFLFGLNLFIVLPELSSFVKERINTADCLRVLPVMLEEIANHLYQNNWDIKNKLEDFKTIGEHYVNKYRILNEKLYEKCQMERLKDENKSKRVKKTYELIKEGLVKELRKLRKNAASKQNRDIARSLKLAQPNSS